MKNRITLSLAIAFAWTSTQAQKLEAPKQRELKPQTAKEFKYTSIDGSTSVRPANFMYTSVGFLKPLHDTKPTNWVFDVRTNQPIAITLKKPIKTAFGVSSEGALENELFAELADYKTWTRIDNWKNEFVNPTLLDDPLGFKHYKYAQYYKGVKVYGGQIVVHENNEGYTYLNGNFYPTPNKVNVNASIKKDAAMAIALRDVKTHTTYTALTEQQKEILGYQKPRVTLVVYHKNRDVNTPQLAYHITIRPNFLDRYEYFVNAHTGALIHHYDNTCAVDGPKTGNATDLNGASKTINSYLIGTSHYLINSTKSMFPGGSINTNNPKGVIWTVNGNNTDATNLTHFTSSSASTWTDKSSVSAHFNAGVAFDYFKNTHARNSINGTGGSIMSIVNVTRDGSAMDNAYWNGSYMAYGNGKNTFKPLAGSLDVAGHEMTHGVVQNTAGLEYNGQSGAINESMADVFGAMMDRSDWKIGEDIMNSSAYLNGALRDLSNPHQGRSQVFTAGYQPAKMSEYYTGTQDNSGVHINSGIPNHAFYKLATAITKEKAEKIAYRALSLYLTQSSQFLDLRFAMEKAAGDLYAATEVNAVKAAFDFVEIFDPNVGSGTGTGDGDDLDPHPGVAKAILSNLNTSLSSTLYRGNANATAWEGISTTNPKSKASVTDDGKTAFFVAANKTIRGINLVTKAEFEAQGQTIWSNVAVSPDGKKLAAITDQNDTAIWVYDFVGEDWYKFTLYNPTNAGIKTYTVEFADALEWNYTSEYVMYDAQNKVNGNTFFDIGIMKAWDKETNKVADGSIEKVFTSIPDGISVGNATFSKISPYIIAMDYINNNTGQIHVAGLNMNSEALFSIFVNTVINYPNYTMDDKSIAFNYNNSGTPIIAMQGLSNSKIDDNGSQATVFSSNVEKIVFYAEGTRNILSDKKDLLSFDFLSLGTPVKGSFAGTTVTLTVPFGTDLSNITSTFTHSPKAKVYVAGTLQTSGASKQNYTNNKVFVVKAEDNSQKSYTIKVNVEAQVSVDELMLSNLKLYPNPAKDHLTIEYPGSFNYTIYSAIGKQVETEVAKNNVSIVTSKLSAGVYWVKVKSAEGEAKVKFVVE